MRAAHRLWADNEISHPKKSGCGRHAFQMVLAKDAAKLFVVFRASSLFDGGLNDRSIGT